MEKNYLDSFKVFNKENLGSIRTLVDEEGTTWFYSNDVTDILEYKNHSDAIKTHTSLEDRKTLKFRDYSETLLSKLWGYSDFKDKILINESGLYTLIFGSQQEKAKEFKSWVTHEVLPSLRKHGGYIVGQEELPLEDQEYYFNEAVRLSDLVEKQKKVLQEKEGKIERLTRSVYTSDDLLVFKDNQIEEVEEENKKLYAKIAKLQEKLYYAENPDAVREEPSERFIDRTTGLSYAKNFKIEA